MQVHYLNHRDHMVKWWNLASTNSSSPNNSGWKDMFGFMRFWQCRFPTWNWPWWSLRSFLCVCYVSQTLRRTVNWSASDCPSICNSSVIDWKPVQSAPFLSSNLYWDSLQPSDIQHRIWKLDGWRMEMLPDVAAHGKHKNMPNYVSRFHMSDNLPNHNWGYKTENHNAWFCVYCQGGILQHAPSHLWICTCTATRMRMLSPLWVHERSWTAHRWMQPCDVNYQKDRNNFLISCFLLRWLPIWEHILPSELDNMI